MKSLSITILEPFGLEIYITEAYFEHFQNLLDSIDNVKHLWQLIKTFRVSMGDLQDPKMEVRYHQRPYLVRDIGISSTS